MSAPSTRGAGQEAGEEAGRAPPDVVVFNPADYRLVHSLPEWTVEGLQKAGHRVLVVEPMGNAVSLMRTALWQRQPVKRRFGLRREGERLWVYAPPPLGLPGTSRRAGVAHLNARTLARLVSRQMRSLGFGDAVLWTYLYTLGETLRALPGRLRIYESGDADLALARTDAQRMTGETLEDELLGVADLVVCCTEELCAPRRARNPEAHEVPCGVDADVFGRALSDETRVPGRVAELPGPVIGYMGGLDPWKMDVDLLVGIARARRDWTIALAGYVWFGFDASPLEAEPNIHVLGPQDYGDFPSILKGIDVGLLPFPYNEITRNGDALKAYEYLAAGLPVVGRDVPVMRRLAPHVRIAEDVEGFVLAIEAALAEPDAMRAERHALARRHGWDVRTRAKLDLIARALERKDAGHGEGAARPVDRAA